MPGSAAASRGWIIRDADDGSLYPSENVFLVVNAEKAGEIVGRFRAKAFAAALIDALEPPPAPTAKPGPSGFRLEMKRDPDRFELKYEDEDDLVDGDLGELTVAPILAAAFLERLGPEHVAAVRKLAAHWEVWQAEFSAALVKENPAVRRLYDVLTAAVREGTIEEDDLDHDTLHELGDVFSFWPLVEKFLPAPTEEATQEAGGRFE